MASRTTKGEDGSKLTVSADGSIVLKAVSAASALRLFAEYVYDGSVGHIRLWRTRDRDLRIDLNIRQLKPLKKKKAKAA
jgi:hypothetical protein